MIKLLTNAWKLFHIGRIFLFLVVFVLIALLLAFFFRRYIPIAWVQQISFPSVPLPGIVVQKPAAAASPTPPVEETTAVKGTDISGVLSEQSKTPTSTTVSATSTRVVMVITLTPTELVSTSTSTATATPAPTLEPTVTATIVSSSNPSPAFTTEPTETFVLETPVPAAAPQLSPVMMSIWKEMQNLGRVMEIAQNMLATVNQGQPTGEEIVVVRSLFDVIDQRMENLAVQLQAAKETSETFGHDAKLSPGQVSDLLGFMQETVRMLQSILSNPAVDRSTLLQAQTALGQLQRLLEQVQNLVLPGANTRQAGTETLTPAPSVTPVPTFTSIPTTTRTLPDDPSEQLDQLRGMLDEMEEILRQMRAVLEQTPN